MAAVALRKVLVCIWLCAAGTALRAQPATSTFREYQFSCDRVMKAWQQYNSRLEAEFSTKNVAWPPADIYLRAFKTQNELELWARNDGDGEYRKIKTYRICAISGLLGPKRQQGDRQVPEGFYFIDEFNPKSDYHLSLQLNYPNYCDELQGKSRLGGDIYIHGGCLTVGCLPMTDDGICELYTVCLGAKLNGQEYIPVHVFPTRLNKVGLSQLMTDYKGNIAKQQFWAGLKKGYDYFETHHRLLPVMYAPDGSYVN